MSVDSLRGIFRNAIDFALYFVQPAYGLSLVHALFLWGLADKHKVIIRFHLDFWINFWLLDLASFKVLLVIVTESQYRYKIKMGGCCDSVEKKVLFRPREPEPDIYNNADGIIEHVKLVPRKFL